jgi:hypothetical protein
MGDLNEGGIVVQHEAKFTGQTLLYDVEAINDVFAEYRG